MRCQIAIMEQYFSQLFQKEKVSKLWNSKQTLTTNKCDDYITIYNGKKSI